MGLVTCLVKGTNPTNSTTFSLAKLDLDFKTSPLV